MRNDQVAVGGVRCKIANAALCASIAIIGAKPHANVGVCRKGGGRAEEDAQEDLSAPEGNRARRAEDERGHHDEQFPSCACTSDADRAMVRKALALISLIADFALGFG